MTHANKDFGFSRSRLGQGIFAATLALCLPGAALATDLLGGGSLLDVDVGIGGIDVEASVGGGSLASACVGHCGAGGTGTGGGTGGNPDGTPGGGALSPTAATTPPRPSGSFWPGVGPPAVAAGATARFTMALSCRIATARRSAGSRTPRWMRICASSAWISLTADRAAPDCGAAVTASKGGLCGSISTQAVCVDGQGPPVSAGGPYRSGQVTIYRSRRWLMAMTTLTVSAPRKL